ncbi:hypothetical protein FRB98_000380 [Tulasnella sp. 332]|nr:hypothetical protein FRB98_000380 [Tulasnella sp. 332]
MGETSSRMFWTIPETPLISVNAKLAGSNHQHNDVPSPPSQHDRFHSHSIELVAVEEDVSAVYHDLSGGDSIDTAIPIMTAAVPTAAQSKHPPEAENWDDDFVFQSEAASTSNATPGKGRRLIATDNNRDSIAWDEEDEPTLSSPPPLRVPRNGKGRQLEEEVAWDESPEKGEDRPHDSRIATPARAQIHDASPDPSPGTWTTEEDGDDDMEGFGAGSPTQRYQELDRTVTVRSAAAISNNTSSTSLQSGSQHHPSPNGHPSYYRPTSPSAYVPASPVTISSAISMGASSTAHLQTHASSSKSRVLAYQPSPPPRTRRRLKKKSRPSNESGWISAGGGAGGDIFEMEDTTGGEGFPEELGEAVPGPSAPQTFSVVPPPHRNPSRNSLLVTLPTPPPPAQPLQFRSPPPSVPSSPSSRQTGHAAFLSRIGSMKSWSSRRKSGNGVTSGDEEGGPSGIRPPRRQSVTSRHPPPVPAPSSPKATSWMFRGRSGTTTPASDSSPSRQAGDIGETVSGGGAQGLGKKGSVSGRSRASKRERGASISKVLGGLGFAGSSSEDSPAGEGEGDDEAGKLHVVRTRPSYGILARTSPSQLPMPPIPVSERTTPPKQLLSSVASSSSFLAVKRTVALGHRRNKSVGAESLVFAEDVISEADKERSRLAAFSPPDPQVTPRPNAPPRSVSVGGLVPPLVVLPDTYLRVGAAARMSQLEEADPFSFPPSSPGPITPRRPIVRSPSGPSTSPFLSLSPPSPNPTQSHLIHHRLPSPSPSPISSNNASHRPHSAASRPLTTSSSHPYSYSLGRANGVSLLSDAADRTHSASSTMRRNNSLGDLKKKQAETEKQQHPLGHLKIPARISQLQVGLKRDLELVRDFANNVDDLKALQIEYRELVTKSQVRNEMNMRDTSGRPSTPPPAIMLLQEKYALWWECADVLIELGGGSTSTSSPPPLEVPPPSSSVAHQPVLSASTTEVHLQVDERPNQRERAVTLAGGSSPTSGGPSVTAAGGRELNRRQLGLLRRMLNEPDPAVFELKVFSMTPTPPVPRMANNGGAGMEEQGRQPPPPNPIFRPQSVPQSRSLHPNISAVTLPDSASPRVSSDASSSVPDPSTTSVSENVTPERARAATASPAVMTPRRLSRVNAGLGALRDMLKGLKKGSSHGSGGAVGHGSAGHVVGNGNGDGSSSSVSKPEAPNNSDLGGRPPPPPSTPGFLGHRRTKTSSAARTSAEAQLALAAASGRRPSAPLPDHLITDPMLYTPNSGDEPPSRPYASQAARQAKQSPRKPSLASLFRLGNIAGGGSGLKEMVKTKAKEGRKKKNGLAESGPSGIGPNSSDESDWERMESASDLEQQIAAATAAGNSSRKGSSASRSTTADSDTGNSGVNATFGQATVRGKRRSPVVAMTSASQSSLSLRGSPQPQKRSVPKAASVQLALAVTDEAGHTPPATKRSVSAQHSTSKGGSSMPPLPAAQFDSLSTTIPPIRHQRDWSSTIRSAPPTSHGHPPFPNNTDGGAAPTVATAPPRAPSNKLALTPENIQPLLEYAKEVSTRCRNCVGEMRNEVARM